MLEFASLHNRKLEIIGFTVLLGCRVGYFGNDCKQQCRYPSFGDGCQMMCHCTADHCDHVCGCYMTHLKGISLLHMLYIILMFKA